jgi:phosphoribosylformylglycinamidine cyclo-ligase
MPYDQFVNYRLVEEFRSVAMRRVAEATRLFPMNRGVMVNESGSWFERSRPGISYRSVTEGPGHMPWVAMWMYLQTGRPYFDVAVWNTGMAAINDLITTGHMPSTMTDDITVHGYDLFSDPIACDSFVRGFIHLCEQHSMSLTGGETASLPFLMNPREPARFAPNMSATVNGILKPAKDEIQSRVHPGDCILGAISSGPHVNGYSTLIDLGLQLKGEFLAEVPGTDGRTFGEMALVSTTSYAALVQALLGSRVQITGLLPGTGDGLRKLFRMGDFVYVIQNWPRPQPFFQFVRSFGMDQLEFLTTFNNGIGYYLFVPAKEADRARRVGEAAGYPIYELGHVQTGSPVVDFIPEKIQIPPR